MTCPSCGHPNPAESSFCLECGSPLVPACAQCGTQLPLNAKFCNKCGAAVGGRGSRPAADEAEEGSTGALRPGSGQASPSQGALRALAPPHPRHRLAAVDWLLLGTLLPVCVFGFVMTVVHGLRGDFVVVPFIVSSAPDAQSYPMVARLLSAPSAEASPLAVGDRLLRLDEERPARRVQRRIRTALVASGAGRCPLAAADDRTRQRALRHPRATRSWV